MILICLVISICTYCSVYSPYEANVGYSKYSMISSCQYEFKSTSSYASMVQYQTVKPLDKGGFVSSEYTTNSSYKPRNVRKGLDLDDEDEPTAGLVPIGDPDIITCVILFVLGIIIIQKHNQKGCAFLFLYIKERYLNKQ